MLRRREAWTAPTVSVSDDPFGLFRGDGEGDPLLAALLSPAVREAIGGLLERWLDQSAAVGDQFVGAAPTDSGFSSQWHLTSATGGINLRDVWTDFTGRGVKVAVLDDGFDYDHPELDGNYLAAVDYDWRMRDADPTYDTTSNRHGTAVMGVIGAERDGTGVVGIAYDADLVGLRIGFGSSGTATQYANALRDGARFDVVNSSWGYSTPFQDDFNALQFSGAQSALVHGTTAGRGGLGTLYTFSAGNARGSGDNVGHHSFQTNPYVVTVAATDSGGRVASFSTPGAAVLVAGPGVGIRTTDIAGAGGYGGGDTASVSGTSFSAPAAAGVLALVLDANAALGWRDAHEILAYSARLTDAARPTWQWNAARDWNGGGLHTSTDYGFGLLDAHAAVRLAETWTQQSTSANWLTASASASPRVAVPDMGSVTSRVSVGTDMRVERVEVAMEILHAWRGDLRVTLVSPSGTESVLINRPGVGPSGGVGSSADDVWFDVGSTQFWGESARGTWTLRVQDLKTGDVGTLNNWSLRVMGEAAASAANNTYVYTNEFGSLGASQAARRALSDSSGTDGINASAVTTPTQIDLQSGVATIAGQTVTFAAGTVIERAFAGDANDAVRGNAAANWIWGGRGDDLLAGRAGADVFGFGPRSGNDVVEDFAGEDEVWLMGGVSVASLAGNVATLSDGATITAANGWQWSAADFVAKAGWLA